MENLSTGNAGSRAWPADKSLAKSLGMRIDWGEIYLKNGKRMRNLCLQPNADADNAAIKAKANKSTHQSLGVIAIDVDNPPTEEEIIGVIRSSLDI